MGKYKKFLECVGKNELFSEGLIKSYSIYALEEKLKQKYKEVYIDSEQNVIVVANVPHNNNEYKNIEKMISVYGYFIGAKHIGDYRNTVTYLIEPKYNIEVDLEDIKEKYKYGFHITNDLYIDKIKKIGLVPKISNRNFFNYPHSRIYLLFTKKQEHLISLKEKLELADQGKDVHNKPRKYYFLVIDLNKLPNDIPLYKDPRLTEDYSGNSIGLYTTHNIPRNAITDIFEA